MRIAFVNQPANTIVLPKQDQPLRSGSIGLWLFQVARRMAAARHDVWVLSSGPKRGSESHESCRFETIPTGRDGARLRIANRYRALRNRIGLSAPANRPPFDSKSYYLDYQRGIAEVLQIEPDWIVVENFSQFVPPLRRQFPRARIAIHMHCDWLAQLDSARIEARLRDCDLVLGCSEHVAQRVRDRFPAHAAKCHAIVNGVDLERFTPGPKTSVDPEILFVGRLSPEKGVHILIDAFRKISERRPTARLRLIGTPRSVPFEYVVALDHDPIVRALSRFYKPGQSYQAQLVDSIGAELAHRVEFSQELPHHELVEAYRRASIFTFPSTWHEPFGLPVIEAMSCEIPVIATRSGGIPEILGNAENGLLIDRGNVGQLAAALSKLLSDAELRSKLGQNGRKRVMTTFSWEQTTSALIDCLETCDVPR